MLECCVNVLCYVCVCVFVFLLSFSSFSSVCVNYLFVLFISILFSVYRLCHYF